MFGDLSCHFLIWLSNTIIIYANMLAVGREVMAHILDTLCIVSLPQDLYILSLRSGVFFPT